MRILKQLCLALVLLICLTATSQTIDKFSIDSGGASTASGGIEILYTIGEVNIQELSSATFLVSEGFINSELQLAININPIIFLQGASINPITGEEMWMRDNLRTASLLTTTSPYSDGLTINASVFIPTGNNAIVDWVWIELRDENDNTIVVDSQSALLQRDGDVVAVDGVSELSFNLSDGNYYIAINHRNHLGIISATSVALSGSTTTVDFSSDPIAILGGTNAVIELDNGIFAMYGGDFNGDGQILNADVNAVLLMTGTFGYSNGDADLNGQILNTDIQLIIQPNSGRGQQY